MMCSFIPGLYLSMKEMNEQKWVSLFPKDPQLVLLHVRDDTLLVFAGCQKLHSHSLGEWKHPAIHCSGS